MGEDFASVRWLVIHTFPIITGSAVANAVTGPAQGMVSYLANRR